jgi:hypothetical protein
VSFPLSSLRLLALPVLLGTWLLAAPSAAALSCMPVTSLADQVTREPQRTAIFTGTAGPATPRGVPVKIERWFTGPGAGAVVWLGSDGFDPTWGPAVPPAGSRWIWVTYVPDPGRDPLAGPCLPMLGLDTPEGQALLDEAVRTFGPGELVAPPAAGTDLAPIALAAGLSTFVGLVFLGIVVRTARRRRT